MGFLYQRAAATSAVNDATAGSALDLQNENSAISIKLATAVSRRVALLLLSTGLRLRLHIRSCKTCAHMDNLRCCSKVRREAERGLARAQSKCSCDERKRHAYRKPLTESSRLPKFARHTESRLRSRICWIGMDACDCHRIFVCVP